MKIQVLADNRNSWIIPYAQELVSELRQRSHESSLVFDHGDVTEGDILCLLSCEKIFKRLNLNKHNLVVHESDLPAGKGWSPVTWQVLEGKNRIPVTLFEATDSVDSGVIYKQIFMTLEGHELLPEIKRMQGEITQRLILDFIDKYPDHTYREQQGTTSFYRKRMPEDSALDIHKSIAEQFNLLRVCDNERYPAFFQLQGKKYIIKIEKA
jgi:methionyl-tRNA formyltransferase